MSLSPEQVVMEREDEHEKRCCGAGRFVLLRDPSPEELSIAQETWDEVVEGGLCLPDPEISACAKCGCKQTFFPFCFPMAVNAPCCILGRVMSLQHSEEPCICGMGQTGGCACLSLCPVILLGGIPPGFPIQFSIVASVLATIQREQIVKKYKLGTHHAVPCCYPIAFYRHFMFLSKMKNKLSKSAA